MNYVFYDFETTGLDTKFSQPIQIAAVCLDENFKELDRIDQKCKLNDGIIPHPAAMLVTKVPIHILKNGQSLYNMMDYVHDKFKSWGPAVFIGYNSIRFDEEILRSGFFQSLHDPYLTNTNKNARTDLFKIVLGLVALNNGIIKIPVNEKTKRPSFKLELIAKANGIEHIKAHDALSDVYATIEVARIIKDKAPDYWNECMKILGPRDLMEYIQNHDYFYAAPEHAAANVKYKPLSFLTNNPNNNKELAFFDLNYEPKKHYESGISKIISMIESKQKVIRLYQSNKAPIILSSDFIKSFEIYKSDELDTFKKRADEIKSQEAFIDKTNFALVERYDDFQITREPSEFLEAQIYNGGFYSSSDKEKITLFKNSDNAENKYSISKQFQDRRLREISYRILFSESPHIFTDEQLLERKRFIADKVFCTEEKVKWCTLEKAKDELQSIKESDKHEDQKSYIQEIESYLISEEERYKAYLLGNNFS
jgi:exodeoxyribonuclease I